MDLQRRLTRFEVVANDVKYGLRGRPFSWPAWQRKLCLPVAALMGCTLSTETALKKCGLRLKRGAKPVGRAYYEAPLAFWADLYVVEVQTAKSQNTQISAPAAGCGTSLG